MKYKNFLKNKSGLFRKIIAGSLSVVFGTGVFSNCAVIASEEQLNLSKVDLDFANEIISNAEKREKNKKKEEEFISSKGEIPIIIRNKMINDEEKFEKSSSYEEDNNEIGSILRGIHEIGKINFDEKNEEKNESGEEIIEEDLFDGNRPIPGKKTKNKKANFLQLKLKFFDKFKNHKENNLTEERSYKNRTKKEKIPGVSQKELEEGKSVDDNDSDIVNLMKKQQTKLEKFLELIKLDANLRGWVILFFFILVCIVIFLPVYLIKNKNESTKNSKKQNGKKQVKDSVDQTSKISWVAVSPYLIF